MRTPDGLKRCVECRKPKPPTLEFFYACRATTDGLQGRCKLCDAAHGRKDCKRRVLREQP